MEADESYLRVVKNVTGQCPEPPPGSLEDKPTYDTNCHRASVGCLPPREWLCEWLCDRPAYTQRMAMRSSRLCEWLCDRPDCRHAAVDGYYTDKALVKNSHFESGYFYRWDQLGDRGSDLSFGAASEAAYGAWSDIFRDSEEAEHDSYVYQLPSFRLFWYTLTTTMLFVSGIILVVGVRWGHLMLSDCLAEQNYDSRAVEHNDGKEMLFLWGVRNYTFASCFLPAFAVVLLYIAVLGILGFVCFMELLRVAIQMQSPRVNAEALVTAHVHLIIPLIVAPFGFLALWAVIIAWWKWWRKWCSKGCNVDDDKKPWDFTENKLYDDFTENEVREVL
uniref:Uncharacterized protein n=1 Tax=Lotharella oceanica TaxID=641309 RepID=A0A7S2X5M6_9EUKA|mmetsp:Transcript_10171/g.19526  ORF Transcript_10171/g.19526 Transcript_10171/m.19526 type:complete len:333 (+) Transcript_10171:374-1372(+)